MMRMSDRMISNLVNKGLLQTELCPETRKRIIPASEIENFCASYVSLSDLCQSGMAPRSVLACLKKNGLQPELDRPKFEKIYFRRSDNLKRLAATLGLNASQL